MDKIVRSLRGQRRRLAAIAIVSASTWIAAQPVAAAPVDAANAACRAAIAKGVSRLSGTTMKAFDGCISAALKGDTVDCSDHITADLKSKIPTAQAKLADAIAKSCDDTATAVALAEFQRCGAPVGTHISSFTSLPNCLNSMVPENIDALRNYMMRPDYTGGNAATDKCVKAIAKNSAKLTKTMQKEKNKLIKTSDSSGGDSDYLDPGDPAGKIGLAIGKALEGIYTSCEFLTVEEWETVNTCDHDPFNTAICVVQNVAQLADGLVAASYDLPGICPAYVDVLFLKGSHDGISVRKASGYDMGWKGAQHHVDSGDYFTLGLGVDCGSATDNSCSSCTLSANCDDGNCRCRDDMTISCDEPDTADADCGGGMCDYLLGPPLPILQGGMPLCLIQRLESLGGSASFGSGTTTIDGNLRQVIHLGISALEACPICGPDALCSGGPRDGLACTAEAGSDFGDLTYDCPPFSGSNITGTGLGSAVTFSTTNSSLTSALPCDAPVASSSCPCSACSGDPSLACDSDADCIAAGAGVCGTSPAEHHGADRRPNDCSDLTCTAIPGDPGNGQCLADEDSWCDGYVAGNGEGVFPCDVNADCALVSAGACTETRHPRCFLDPIVASAEGGPQIGVDDGVLGATFCVPPTTGSLVDDAIGLPGPERMQLATEFYSVCANGFSLWSPGGATCQ